MAFFGVQITTEPWRHQARPPAPLNKSVSPTSDYNHASHTCEHCVCIALLKLVNCFILHRCWISEENGAIWAFIGPMLLIILVNPTNNLCNLIYLNKFIHR